MACVRANGSNIKPAKELRQDFIETTALGFLSSVGIKTLG
jgi:hypothetical protein